MKGNRGEEMQPLSVLQQLGVLAMMIVPPNHTANIQIGDSERTIAGYLTEERYKLHRAPDELYRLLSRSEISLQSDLGTSTPHTIPTGWLDEVEITLEKLTHLENDWNKKGAIPTSADNAKKALKILPITAEAQLPKPFLYPGTDGGVVMNYEDEGEVLNILVENNRLHILLSNDGNTIRFYGETNEAAFNQTKEFLDLILEQFTEKNGGNLET